MVDQNYILNLIPEAGFKVIARVSQYDKGRKLIFTLYKGAEEFTPAEGTGAIIEGCKPDGTIFNYAGEISGSDVTVTTTEQMTVVAGNTTCELRLLDAEGTNIGTANFILQVETTPMSKGVMSQHDLEWLQDSIGSTASNAIAAQEAATEVREASQQAKDIKEEFDKVKFADLLDNMVVQGGGWVADEKYKSLGYGYRGDIAAAEIKGDMIPEVVLDPTADANKIAPFAETGDGKVSLYATENIAENTAITRLSIRNRNDISATEIVPLDGGDIVHVTSSLSETAEGYVLDGRVGKTLNDKIENAKTALAKSQQAADKELQEAIDGNTKAIQTNTTSINKNVQAVSDNAKAIANKLDAAKVVNNLTTETAGSALDARQGKTLHEEAVRRFAATFTMDGWSSGTYCDGAYTFSQEVSPDAAVSDKTELGPAMTRLTDNAETNTALKSNLEIISEGLCKISNGKICIYTAEKPSCDLDIIFYGKDV